MVHANSASEVKIIRNRLMKWAESYRVRGDLPRKAVSEYLKLLNSDGSFSDKESTIDVMTGRLLFMAQAFKSNSKWKNKPYLKTGLYSAIQYWLNHDPGNSGWTAGCFNEPGAMDSIGLCLYDAIQKDKIDHPEMIPQLDTLVSGMVNWANASWTAINHDEFFVGANITYRLMGMIGRAALADSPKMFDDITNIVASTFTVGKSHSTGRLADESWHQHNIGGGQNYWLGYGADWLHITRRSFEYLKGTRWALTDKQLNELADCIIDGWQWLIYRNTALYSVGGRHNLVKSPAYSSDFLIGQIDALQNLAGTKKLIRNDELEEIKKRLANPAISFPSFSASKYFYKSDLMIYGKPYFYVAVKMISKRSTGPESGSGNGKLNYHFGEGSTIILRTGNEYKNARVAWNFRAIPGTTVEQNNDTLPLMDWAIKNANSLNIFAGGIADGNFGLCAFELNRACSYSKVTANKGYYFFDDGFAAIGSKIIKHPPFRNYEVWTTIDQPERKTDIFYSINDGFIHIIPLTATVRVDFTNITKGAWFYCNDKGYIILPDKRGVDLKLWAENRTGDWHNLDARYKQGDTQSVNIFQLSINHHTKPKSGKYAYFVFPNITKKRLKEYFSDSPVKVLENSDSIQAVQFSNSNITEIVFYEANSIVLKSGLKVSVNRPAVILLKKSGNDLEISIADPNEDQKKIIMAVNKKVTGGKNIIYNPQTGISKITFSLPQGIYLGKAVKQNFKIER